MAPVLDQVSSLLQTRATCPYGYHSDSGGCYRDGWYWYGRWIFAAVVIGIFLLSFFLWACINSRRRRRRGNPPMYGTGWMAPNNQQYHNPQGFNQPPPAYGAPAQSYPMDNRYQTTDGPYNQYNQQSSGIEPPKNVYTGDYAPPAGPPPHK